MIDAWQFDVLRPGDMVRKIMTRIDGDTRVADTMQHQSRYADRRQNMPGVRPELHSDDRRGGRWTGALPFKARKSTPKGFVGRCASTKALGGIFAGAPGPVDRGDMFVDILGRQCRWMTGEASVKNKSPRPIRIGSREQERHRTALGYTIECGLFAKRRIHYRAHIVHALF